MPKNRGLLNQAMDKVRDALKRREEAAQAAATTVSHEATSAAQGYMPDTTSAANLEAQAAASAQAFQAQAAAAAAAASAQAQAAVAAAQAAAEAAKEAEGKFIEYKVVYGDTLWDLAVKYYGDGMKYKDIYEANKELIGPDVNTLYPDWMLKIPRP